MRPRGDLPAQSSTTNSRSAVVGKGEVLAFYVGDVVGEYKLLHWSECLAACSLYSEAERALRRYCVLALCSRSALHFKVVVHKVNARYGRSWHSSDGVRRAQIHGLR